MRTYTSFKPILLLLSGILALPFLSSAQSVGEFRSITPGSWFNATTWETYNGSAWVSASSAPSANAPKITVRHKVDVSGTPLIIGTTSTVQIDTNGTVKLFTALTNNGTINADGKLAWFSNNILTADSATTGAININQRGIFDISSLSNLQATNQRVTLKGTFNKLGIDTITFSGLRDSVGFFNADSTCSFTNWDGNLRIQTIGTLNCEVTNFGTLALTDSVGLNYNGKMFRNNSRVTGLLNLQTRDSMKLVGSGQYDRLIVNTKSVVFAPNGVNIERDLSLTNGRINLEGNNLTIGTSPTNRGRVINSSDSGYVFNGLLIRWAGTQRGDTLVFPVGISNAFLPATLVMDSVTRGGKISIKYQTTDPLEFGLPLTDAGGNEVDATCASCGIWEILKADTNIIVSNYRVIFLVNGYPGVTTPANIRVIQRDLPSTPWQLRGSHVPGNGTAVRFFARRTNLSVFGEFAIAGNELENNLLPVDLVSFVGQRSGSTTQLTWRTATERNTSFFDVQKSTDGISFASIGRVKAVGTTTQAQSYQFLDEKPASGINYYRLRIVDFDNRVDVSQTVSVWFDASVQMWVYPNPTADNWIISAATSDEKGAPQAFNVDVMDVTGKVLFNAKNVDNQQVNIPSKAWSSGVYFARVSRGANISVFKLVKH
ncbi:MAG: T9SS type A sorting domain-containing protein [Saprospiraceae bacterium]|nr:T9SS type A sorting domain-containing protein [Saprospiraceae bacterium]